MSSKTRNYNNNLSLMFGVLCIGVVYLHSGWAGGFDILALGIDSDILKQGMGLLLMTVVPSFFILWGYLSCKYFYSDEKPIVFLKNKIIQFYPLYLLSFLLNIIFRYDYIVSLPKWKILFALFGFYYESGLRGGGHIYLVVLSVVITITLFKMFKLGRKSIFIFTLICLIITKLVFHDESGICYVVYFGYYAAFFLGASLKLLSYFDGPFKSNKKPEIFIIIAIWAVGIITPILNLFKIYFVEIDYNPNSFEQLCFCTILLYLIYRFIERFSFLKGNFFLVRILHKIGNNAYGHFILQSHIIRLFIFLNAYLSLNKVILQLIIVLITSYIVVYLILPIYSKFEAAIIYRNRSLGY